VGTATTIMVRLQFDNNKQFKITLPKAIVLAKGWTKGDDISIEIDDSGNLLLKKRVKQAEEGGKK